MSAVKTLKIPKYQDCDFSSDNVDHPSLKTIVKKENHPSILSVASKQTEQANNRKIPKH